MPLRTGAVEDGFARARLSQALWKPRRNGGFHPSPRPEGRARAAGDFGGLGEGAGEAVGIQGGGVGEVVGEGAVEDVAGAEGVEDGEVGDGEFAGGVGGGPEDRGGAAGDGGVGDAMGVEVGEGAGGGGGRGGGWVEVGGADGDIDGGKEVFSARFPAAAVEKGEAAEGSGGWSQGEGEIHVVGVECHERGSFDEGGWVAWERERAVLGGVDGGYGTFTGACGDQDRGEGGGFGGGLGQVDDADAQVGQVVGDGCGERVRADRREESGITPEMAVGGGGVRCGAARGGELGEGGEFFVRGRDVGHELDQVQSAESDKKGTGHRSV